MKLTYGMMLKTIISRIVLVLIGVIFFIPFCMAAILPVRARRSSKLIAFFMYWYYRAVLVASFVPITVRGARNIPRDRSLIFAANHQSSLDIPLLGALAGVHPHIWLARSELMKDIVLRILLGSFAEVIDVTAPRKAVRSLLRVIASTKEAPFHIMIFPEGERHTDGDVHQFFGGFVALAKRTGYPVVPVRIFGPEKAYPPYTFWIYPHPITVVVGKPFEYDPKKGDDNVFKETVYQWFQEQEE